MPNIINPFEFMRFDRCHKCDWEDIELFDYFNRPLNYNQIVTDHMLGKSSIILDKKAVYRMRCTRCKHTYTIIWDNDFPRPMWEEDSRLDRFINNFSK